MIIKNMLVAGVAVFLSGVVWLCDLTPPWDDFAVTNAQAQSMAIEQARAGGLVGELPNGLLGAVKSSPDVKTLVDYINQSRMTKYRAIAADQKIPVESVQAIAGAKLIDHLNPGEFYQKGGQWLQR